MCTCVHEADVDEPLARRSCPEPFGLRSALTFPPSPLFRQVLTGLERKIDRKAALSNKSHGSNSMAINEDEALWALRTPLRRADPIWTSSINMD